MAWKVDRRAAIWGVAFGTMATLTGMFLLRAVEGGFMAEGFFLIVLSWIVFFVILARIAVWLRRR